MRARSRYQRTLALGGYNFGEILEILFVDLARQRGRLTVVPGYGRDGRVEIDVQASPLRSRLGEPSSQRLPIASLRVQAMSTDNALRYVRQFGAVPEHARKRLSVWRYWSFERAAFG